MARKQAVAQILPDSGEKWGGFGMPVIAVASPVAGSGRTTLATHLAVEAGRAGNGPVTLLDPAPGYDLTQWVSARNRPTPEYELVYSHPNVKLPELEKAGTQLCIADSLATDPQELQFLVDLADLVVIPCPLEEEALKSAAAFACTVRDSGAVAAVVVTRAAPGEEFWNETTRRLKREELLCPAVLHRDDGVAAAMARGLTAGEADGSGSAAGDIRHLWQVLEQALPQPPRRPRWSRREGRGPKAVSPMRSVAVIRDGNGLESAVLAVHLAVQAIRSGVAGSLVTLTETEAKGPLVRWGVARGVADPAVRYAAVSRLALELRALRESGARMCFLHLPAESVRSTPPPNVDLYVLPLRFEGSAAPSGIAPDTVLDRLDRLPRGAPAAVVLCGESMKRQRTAVAALQDRCDRIAGRLHWSDDLESALRAGTTVMEGQSDSRAAREFAELWAALRKIMGGK